MDIFPALFLWSVFFLGLVESKTALTYSTPILFLQHYVWILAILVLMESFLLLWEQHCKRTFLKTHLLFLGHDKVNRSREKSLCRCVAHKKKKPPENPFFFFSSCSSSVVLFFSWNTYNRRGRVNKAWLGVAEQLFSGFPQLPLVTHRQLLPVLSLTREWAEGKEEEWRCFHCVFYDLSLTAPIVARQGEKEKGSQLRRAAFRMDQSPLQLPDLLIDANTW